MTCVTVHSLYTYKYNMKTYNVFNRLTSTFSKYFFVFFKEKSFLILD